MLEIATCILMEHVVTGQRLYSVSPSTYTRCQENIGSLQLVAGGFAAAGPYVRKDVEVARAVAASVGASLGTIDAVTEPLLTTGDDT